MPHRKTEGAAFLAVGTAAGKVDSSTGRLLGDTTAPITMGDQRLCELARMLREAGGFVRAVLSRAGTVAA